VAVSWQVRAGQLDADVHLPDGVEGDLVWGQVRRPLASGHSRLTVPAPGR
jgi:hypothetical protein